MKRLVVILVMLAALVALSSCNWIDDNVGTLTLSVPDSAYPPCEVLIVAGGVTGGQYTFEVEGNTRTQASSSLRIEIAAVPCEVTVTWIGDGTPQTVTKIIYLENDGPVIGRPRLNGIVNLWTIHADHNKYTVTFPNAYDPEGGPVTLIDASVWHVAQNEPNTIFCPPYTGMNPPKPDLYRVRTGQGDILNAFIFWSVWNGPIDEITQSYPDASGLHYTPPSLSLSSYPGGSGCGLNWPPEDQPISTTIITATFEDEMGATTTRSWEIPTMPYYGCGVQTPSSCP